MDKTQDQIATMQARAYAIGTEIVGRPITAFRIEELLGSSPARTSGSDPDCESSTLSAPAIDWDAMPGGMDDPIRD